MAQGLCPDPLLLEIRNRTDDESRFWMIEGLAQTQALDLSKAK